MNQFESIKQIGEGPEGTESILTQNPIEVVADRDQRRMRSAHDIGSYGITSAATLDENGGFLNRDENGNHIITITQSEDFAATKPQQGEIGYSDNPTRKPAPQILGRTEKF